MHLRGCMTTQNSSLRSTSASASAGIIPPSVAHKTKKTTVRVTLSGFVHDGYGEIKECAFERFVAEHAIPEQLWPESDELRAWCKRNAACRYIPENLLAAFNISINDKLSFIHVEGR
jgi:hypothetical protein